MGRILYFDAFNGASGDMILGALVDMGLPLEVLQSELSSLQLKGFELRAERIEREGLKGTNLQVLISSEESSHGNHHGRGFSAVRNLIESSDLEEWVQEKAIAIFRRLAEAEAKVHGSTIEQVHFHEVGAVDSIVDVVGSCIGFLHFEVDEFWSSPLALGTGTVRFSHGEWPVPAPATLELVRGFATRPGGIEAELTTPTGAAIITTLAVGQTGVANFERWGIGAGDRRLPGIPNMLRLMLGSSLRSHSSEWAGADGAGVVAEEICLLEANIDDMDAEMFGYFLNRALEAGALDVFYTPIQMKKNRPGVLLSVLCRPEDQERLAELVFRETTTLGLRVHPHQRWRLPRQLSVFSSRHGDVRVKVVSLRGEVLSLVPEHDDVERIARETGLPLRTVRSHIIEEITEQGI